MSFLSAKSQLINEIFMTREFNQLRLQKNRLYENKESITLIKNYQNKREQAEQSGDTGHIKELEDEYRKLSQVPEINAYFSAVEAMNKLLSGIMNDISNAIDSSLR